MGELLNTIICDDVLNGIKKLPDKSIDCVITSPPYWQLRDYGYDGQWGLEPTFEQYLDNLWLLMDEIYRVLKDDGTVWINLGDTYSGSGNGQGDKNAHLRLGGKCYSQQNFSGIKAGRTNVKNKCLLLIPHRFAIGCIDRGWIMRNDIIWAKRNGMPESVTDRFSKKHEYFFFMVKQEKYFFDLDAIRDRHLWADKDKRSRIKGGVKNKTGLSVNGQYSIGGTSYNQKGKNPGSVADFWDIPTNGSNTKHYASYNDSLIAKPILAGCPVGGGNFRPIYGNRQYWRGSN